MPKAVSPRPSTSRRAQPRQLDIITAKTPRLAAPRLVVAKTVAPPAAEPISELARQIPIDMELPGQDSNWKAARFQRRRKTALRATAVALVLVMTFGGLLISQSYLKLHKAFRGTAGTAAALKENVDPDLLKGEGSGRVNVLLMGRGGGSHTAPDLTDTIMLASIDPVNHAVSLLSVPRDLWVNVPNAGVMKLNAAWETGEFKYLGRSTAGSTDPKAVQAGFELADETVKQVLGVTIDYNVLVDFQAFKQAVDTVGGVSVEVPSDLVDPTMAWENGGNPTLAAAGPQQFNGDKALLYVRSRETSSDFARAQRQRAVLLALKNKVDSAGTLSNPLKLSGLISAFGNNIATDLSLSNANRMYGILKKIDPVNVRSLSLNETSNQLVTTGNVNGQSVVLPKAGLFNYEAIQNFVHSQLKDPFLVKENARVLVLNGTDTAGLATAKADELKAFGYNVIGAASTATPIRGKTMLVALNPKDKYTRNYLERRFGVKAQTRVADKSIPTDGADFVIILGSDEVNPS